MNYARTHSRTRSATRSRDAESEAEYRANWRRTRHALAEYLAYVIGERFVEGSRQIPIYATPDTIKALRALGLDPRRYGIETNRPADPRAVDELVQDLERIYRGRAYERDTRRRRPGNMSSMSAVRDARSSRWARGRRAY